MGKQKNIAEKTSKPNPQTPSPVKQTLKLGSKNWILIGTGIIFIVIGFFVLHLKMLTLATLLLIIGYCIIIPVGILIRQPAGKKS